MLKKYIFTKYWSVRFRVVPSRHPRNDEIERGGSSNDGGEKSFILFPIPSRILALRTRTSLIFIFILILIPPPLHAQLWTVTEMTPLPEAVTNNAVCEGFIGDTTFVFSFGGLDNTKAYSGIHSRSFRYNTVTAKWISISPLPDTLGKIAMGANRIGDIIYILGGYHVYANGGEKSSNRVHRYDVQANTYLADGAPIPVPIDDQVQAVWRDSLIFLVTGWSENTNRPEVQIYDPVNNSWAMGTPVPNNNTYKSFGASGSIFEDTIYYFGGAAFGQNFPIQNTLRKGVIDPNDPTQITWSSTILANSLVGYRMASTIVDQFVHWLGGSATTYNFDGIAYNGTGGVSPSDQNLFFSAKNRAWAVRTDTPFPMDLRGIAKTAGLERYLVGGMAANQTVSDKTLRLTYIRLGPNDLHDPAAFYAEPLVFPNPFIDRVHIEWKFRQPYGGNLFLYNISGELIEKQAIDAEKVEINLGGLPPGIYVMEFTSSVGSYWKKIIKL